MVNWRLPKSDNHQQSVRTQLKIANHYRCCWKTRGEPIHPVSSHAKPFIVQWKGFKPCQRREQVSMVPQIDTPLYHYTENDKKDLKLMTTIHIWPVNRKVPRRGSLMGHSPRVFHKRSRVAIGNSLPLGPPYYHRYGYSMLSRSPPHIPQTIHFPHIFPSPFFCPWHAKPEDLSHFNIDCIPVSYHCAMAYQLHIIAW